MTGKNFAPAFSTVSGLQNFALAGASAEIFPGGGRGANVDILLILFRLLTMQRKWPFTKRFTLSTPQRKCPISRQQLQTVFPRRNFYTEQMFVLVSVNILRLS